MEHSRTNKPRKQRLALDITLRSNSAPVKPAQNQFNTDQNSASRELAGSAQHDVHPGTKTISISLGSRSKTNRPQRTRRFILIKRILISIFVIATIGLIITAVLNLKSNTPKQTTSSSSSNRPVGNPEYQTVLPAGKSIDELGDWKRVSPPGGDPVFAYLDKIDNVSISVSQQPIPKSLKGNAEEQIAELAKKFNATTRIDADGTKVYVGSSAKGPQSAILTKNNLLILIKSQEKVTDTSWAKYAKSLH